jgi:hypothetical protein
MREKKETRFQMSKTYPISHTALRPEGRGQAALDAAHMRD